MDFKWISMSEEVPDKDKNKEVIFIVPKQSTRADGAINSFSGVIFYTWANLPSLEFIASVGGKWMEVPVIDFIK